MTAVAHPVETIRSAEAPLIRAAVQAGDPDAVMRRAAHGLAHHCAQLLRRRRGRLYGARVLVLVGAGDNGGDALYAGAGLAARGCRVEALALCPGKVHRRGRDALLGAGGRMVGPPARWAGWGDGYDVAVDGIVGLAGTGALRPPADEAVSALEAAGVPVVAVDLPSGIDADTGIAHHRHVRADLTVTFGVLRRAHLLAAPHCGRVEVVDIGVMTPGSDPAETVSAPDPAEVGRRWPVPGAEDDKYTQGVVAVRAGSARYPGAAVLAATAAVAATSGMVRYVGPGAPAVLSRRPEVVCHDSVAETGRVQAWVAGPGMGTDARALGEIEAVLDAAVPTVLDADALTVLAEHPSILLGGRAPVLLTPHAGEFARLAGQPLGTDRAAALRRFVLGLRDRGVEATVLLKGRVTLVDDGRRLLAVDAGSSWAATAGSGDVLAGVVGTLAAHGAGAGRDLAQVAGDAVVAHAAAARLAATRHDPCGAPIGASDLVEALPAAIAHLRSLARASGGRTR